jgi:hypothetical protein
MEDRNRTCSVLPIVLLIFASLLLCSVSAFGCIVRTGIPKVDAPEDYYSIFVAKVEMLSWPPSIFALSDITPPYKITLSSEVEVIRVAH